MPTSPISPTTSSMQLVVPMSRPRLTLIPVGVKQIREPAGDLRERLLRECGVLQRFALEELSGLDDLRHLRRRRLQLVAALLRVGAVRRSEELLHAHHDADDVGHFAESRDQLAGERRHRLPQPRDLQHYLSHLLQPRHGCPPIIRLLRRFPYSANAMMQASLMLAFAPAPIAVIVNAYCCPATAPGVSTYTPLSDTTSPAPPVTPTPRFILAEPALS